jgi:hypothetical protein
LTQLSAGASLSASSFNLYGGEFDGSGDFYGNLNNGDPQNQANAGIVHPGVARGQVGTLTVHGNYTQTTGGTLYIEFAGLAAGQTSLLNVVPSLPGVGGSATVNGTVTVHRAAGFTPGAATVTFLQSVQVAGAPAINSDPLGDTWFDNQGIPRKVLGLALNAPNSTFSVG